MSNPKLAEMLSHAATRMASELKERLLPHRGEQGAAREEVIRQFLRAYLPKRFDVSSGFILTLRTHFFSEHHEPQEGSTRPLRPVSTAEAARAVVAAGA